MKMRHITHHYERISGYSKQINPTRHLHPYVNMLRLSIPKAKASLPRFNKAEGTIRNRLIL